MLTAHFRFEMSSGHSSCAPVGSTSFFGCHWRLRVYFWSMHHEAVTDEEIKEVYARFGLAYYLSEVLFQSVSLLLVAKQVGTGIGMTRPRIEELLSGAYAK